MKRVGSLLGLVVVFGTSSHAEDHDEDGIDDVLEIMGSDTPGMDLPAYGADPVVPDLFVQLDWRPCDPLVHYCGPENHLDVHRSTPRAVARLAAYFAPSIAVHVDTGQWGGAVRLPPGPNPCNAETLGARYGTFHRGVSGPLGGGGGGVLGGYCFGGDGTRMGVLAQELGHNFTLDHFGLATSGAANCKPHYRSPMNYAFTFDPNVVTFSRGRFSEVALNPIALNELAGLGTTDAAVLASLRSTWDLLVRDDGAVDWNRDGRFEARVRAAPNWAWASCEQSSTRIDALGSADHPTLAWLDLAPAPARLYLMARSREAGFLVSRFTTRVDLCYPDGAKGACTQWSPSAESPPRVVPGSAQGSGGPALTAYSFGQERRLLVVYADSDGRLRWQRLSVVDGVERWNAPGFVDPERSWRKATGDPALAELGDKVVLLAPLGGEVARWEFYPERETFSGRTAEVWSGGESIEPCAGAGVALTAGFRRDRPGRTLFAAVPVAPSCMIELGLHDPAKDAWERLPESAWPRNRPMASARPGIAYVPFDSQTPDEGRLYLAWRPFPTGAALISMTEGTDPSASAADRRLRWLRANYMTNMWGIVAGAISLTYDPAFDENLRAAWGYSTDSVVAFFPFADGIVDSELRDMDDYAVIRKNLACSLTGSCK